MPCYSTMQLASRFTCRFWSPRALSTTSLAKVSHCFDEDCNDFLPWLREKAGTEISTVLSIGKSVYGRSLIATESIEAGDCILKVPYNVHIGPNNLLPEIHSLLGDKLDSAAKLAVVILFEQKRGQDSEWAPYITRLPRAGEMHNTIFWSQDELEMIRQSSVYQETFKQRVLLDKDFLTMKSALDRFPEIFADVTIEDFMHAYALVGTRAWGSSKDLSLIPFADFSNHDGETEAVVLSDEGNQLSEVIADRNYDPGEQVLIRYGKFSNATLLLDFGFTTPCNIFDQVQIEVNIPHHDLLHAMKLGLLQRHHTPAMKDVNSINCSVNSFTIKEVRSTKGKGKGIPQSLRAFARVLSSTSLEELNDFAMQATQNDGRLARRPLKNNSREIHAHETLLFHISQLIAEYNASIETLGPVCSPSMPNKHALRKQMARDLLTGELRVLESAAEWLKSYCATLSTTNSDDFSYILKN